MLEEFERLLAGKNDVKSPGQGQRLRAATPAIRTERRTYRRRSPLARLLLIVREDRAVLDVRQRRGHVVGVDGRSERSQRVRQALDLTAVEEARPLQRVREAQDQRCVEPLVGRVVVRDVRGVPEPLAPGQEGLGSQFPQRAGACEGGYELLVDELPEVAGTDAILPPEVDEGSGARLLAGLCHLVPAGRVRQTGVEQGAPEDVDFVLERELGLLAAQQRGQGDWKV